MRERQSGRGNTHCFGRVQLKKKFAQIPPAWLAWGSEISWNINRENKRRPVTRLGDFRSFQRPTFGDPGCVNVNALWQILSCSHAGSKRFNFNYQPTSTRILCPILATTQLMPLQISLFSMRTIYCRIR